jgi:hypothetical protein
MYLVKQSAAGRVVIHQFFMPDKSVADKSVAILEDIYKQSKVEVLR